MTATRRGEGFGRSASDAALRGALLVAVAVIIGALLIWRGHTDDNNGGSLNTGTGPTTSRAANVTTSRGGVTTRTPVTTPGVTTPIGSTRQASQVKVLTANGSGVDGYATQVAQKLATGSYASIGAENAKAGQANTVIYYRDTYQEDARALAVFLGASANVVQAMPASLTDKLDQAVVNRAQGANIVIILGADKEVKVG
ncbi:MAG: LytR C-terminal domain-containing protein [Acidimicrobiales bacterium]